MDLAVGATVTLTGLTNVELNGKRAKVLGWDSANSRYELEIDGKAGTRLIKPANITPEDGVGATAQSEESNKAEEVELRGEEAAAKQKAAAEAKANAEAEIAVNKDQHKLNMQPMARRAVERQHWPYEEELLAIFALIDEDENGVMDFSELLDLGKGVSASFTAEKCRAVLGRMDEDHDGAITKEEFVAFFGKMMRNYSQAANDRGIIKVQTCKPMHKRHL